MLDIPDNSAELGDRFFKELADYAPVMIWRSRVDKLCDWFNKPWLDFVGEAWSRKSATAGPKAFYKDDFDRCLEIYVTSFDARELFA